MVPTKVQDLTVALSIPVIFPSNIIWELHNPSDFGPNAVIAGETYATSDTDTRLQAVKPRARAASHAKITDPQQ